MKFKFTGEYEPMPFQDAIASKRKIEFEAESLGSILEQFEMFLRGCGYVFEGHIDIVDDFAETNELVDEECDLDDVDQFFDRAKETSKQLDTGYALNDFNRTRPIIWPFPDSKETYEQGGDPAHPPSYQPGASKKLDEEKFGDFNADDPRNKTWENKIE